MKRGLCTELSIVRNSGQAYKGDTSSKSYINHQGQKLADDENCSTWCINIPVQVSEREILGKIKCGAVFCVYINKESATHRTKAAKVVFMTPQGARYFVQQSNLGQFFLGGRRIGVIYNREGHKEYKHQSHSRVLAISGPDQLMTLEFWSGYFEEICVHTLEFHQVVCAQGGRTTMEFGFIRGKLREFGSDRRLVSKLFILSSEKPG